MKQFLAKHRLAWTKRDFVFSVLLGMVLLAGSLVVNYLLGTYASARASNAVTDLILDNIPVVNVDVMFIDGFAVFLLCVVGITLREPKGIPFILKSTALFIVIRSVFISLTHIGPFPTISAVDIGPISRTMTFTGDLFFSGHSGYPFLLALIHWKQAYLRAFFLLASVIFAVTVLLGHLHYSIDVFAAFFITYSIFQIAKRFFRSDYQRLERETDVAMGVHAIV